MTKRELEGKDGGRVKAWGFSSSQYVQSAVNNVVKYLKEVKLMPLPNSMDQSLKRDYRPKLDDTAELEPTDAAYYQSLIGVLRWIVELGRVDIATEVSIMSSCMALPRFCHMIQLYNIFAYSKKHHNTEMIFDPSEPVIDELKFPRQDWSDTFFMILMTVTIWKQFPQACLNF